MPSAGNCPSGKRPGITDPSRPSAMRWCWCAGKSGSMRVLRWPIQAGTVLNSRPRYKIDCFRPCVTRPDGRIWIKSSSGPPFQSMNLNSATRKFVSSALCSAAHMRLGLRRGGGCRHCNLCVPFFLRKKWQTQRSTALLSSALIPAACSRRPAISPELGTADCRAEVCPQLRASSDRFID